jgi:DNA-binding MarR family transcriptional regulator
VKPLAESRRRALAAVERQTAILTRHFELLHRRTDIHDSLDRAEYLLLRALDESGPMRINALATLLGLDPSTAGRQVAVLQAGGLVKREPDPADRRCTVVTPTAEGLERMRHVRTLRTELVAGLLAEWSDEDLRTFDAILGKYNKSIAERYLTGSAWEDIYDQVKDD